VSAECEDRLDEASADDPDNKSQVDATGLGTVDLWIGVAEGLGVAAGVMFADGVYMSEG
jgi:hypothetical protein